MPAAAPFLLVAYGLLLLLAPWLSARTEVLNASVFFCAVLAAVRAWQSMRGGRRAAAGALLVLGAILLALGCNAVFSAGRPMPAIPFALPGSWVTRGLVLDIAAWQRRLLEPGIWALLLAAAAAASCFSGGARRLLLAFAVLLLAALCFEIRPLLMAELEFGEGAQRVHYYLLAAGFLCLTAGLVRGAVKTKGRVLPEAAAGVAACLALGAAFAGWASSVWREENAEYSASLGAHYYSWFPENWKAGHSGEVSEPNYEPALGKYLSDDAAVFGAHLAWAKGAGLDFFVFDWWPERRSARQRILRNLEEAANTLDGFRFAVQYETLDLKTTERVLRGDEEPNVMVMTPERAERMRSHWAHIARAYASHPAYLRIGGRPVLFVYASRHVVGDAGRYFLWARREVARQTGVDFYLVGDEVYFNVLSRSAEGEVLLLPEGEPDWQRLSAFDALTCYNPYDSHRTEHGGESGREDFLADVAGLYSHYRAIAAAAGQRFIPAVIPGYDDRGVRPHEGHFVIPRHVGRESLLAEALQRWAAPMLDARNRWLVVTTWNEWNEGTQVEPAREAASNPARAGLCDPSLRGSSYGCSHLSELKQFSRKYHRHKRL